MEENVTHDLIKLDNIQWCLSAVICMSESREHIEKNTREKAQSTFSKATRYCISLNMIDYNAFICDATLRVESWSHMNHLYLIRVNRVLT